MTYLQLAEKLFAEAFMQQTRITPKVLSRTATPEDLEKISALIHRTLWEINSADYTHHEIAEKASWHSPDKLKEMLFGKPHIVISQGQKVLAVGRLDPDKAEIKTVFVDVDYRGTGLGRKVMEHLEAMAQTRNIHKVTLTSSYTAVSFYAKLGWKKIKEVGDYQNWGGGVLMQKDLS